MSLFERQIRAEIDFWREMISNQSSSQNLSARERMQQALSLAERKLLLINPEACERDSERDTEADMVKTRERVH